MSSQGPAGGGGSPRKPPRPPRSPTKKPAAALPLDRAPLLPAAGGGGGGEAAWLQQGGPPGGESSSTDSSHAPLLRSAAGGSGDDLYRDSEGRDFAALNFGGRSRLASYTSEVRLRRAVLCCAALPQGTVCTHALLWQPAMCRSRGMWGMKTGTWPAALVAAARGSRPAAAAQDHAAAAAVGRGGGSAAGEAGG